MAKGRAVALKIHVEDLNPVLDPAVETTLLNDVAIFSTREARRMKVLYRPYVQGECNPYKLPDAPRTRVEVQRFQRVYYVDGEATLYVDLRPKEPGERPKREAQKGKRIWRSTRNNEVLIDKE